VSSRSNRTLAGSNFGARGACFTACGRDASGLVAREAPCHPYSDKRTTHQRARRHAAFVFGASKRHGLSFFRRGLFATYRTLGGASRPFMSTGAIGSRRCRGDSSRFFEPLGRTSARARLSLAPRGLRPGRPTRASSCASVSRPKRCVPATATNMFSNTKFIKVRLNSARAFFLVVG
jgi:hypothetical protein